jgi:hypothetical protein
MHRDRAHGCHSKPWPHVKIMGEASKTLRQGYGTAVLAVSAIFIAQASLAASPELPRTAPVPTHSPASGPQAETTGPQSAPVPTQRPDSPPSTEVKPKADESRDAQGEMFGPPAPLPKAAEVPVVKREMFGPPAPLPKAAEVPPVKREMFGPPTPPPATAPPVDVQEERLCRDDLRELGVDFKPHEPLADAAEGCFVVNPVTLKSLGKTIKLSPEAVLNCDMARATVRFMQDVAAPIAKANLGVELTSINHASAYVCRPRNGTLTMSEHAFGNAIDVASFGLADGTRVDVKAGAEEKQAAFLDAIRKAACGPFKTVLGPGSDADHQLHFHFDLEKRRTGATYCH